MVYVCRMVYNIFSDNILDFATVGSLSKTTTLMKKLRAQCV